MRELLRTTSAFKILSGDVKKNTVAHAYMLCFSDPVYMRSALKEMAKIIVGGGEKKERRIENETFSDCRIYPEQGKKLTVDIAGEIVSESNIKPVEGDIKIFIVEKFEEASPAVQNKLLKVLEEPPQGVVFLLGAANEFSVLPTVKSRARILSVPPFTQGEIEDFLKRNYPSLTPSVRAEYAGACGGIAGSAVQMTEGEYFSCLLSLAKEFVFAKEEDFPPLTAKLNDLKQKKEFVALLKIVFRDMLMYKSGLDEAILKADEDWIRSASVRYTPQKIVSAIEELTSAERDIKFNASFAVLALDLLIKISAPEKNNLNNKGE